MIIKKPWPVFDEKSVGAYYIQPIQSFTARGYWWSKTLRFEAEHFAVPINDKVVWRFSTWGKPKLLQEIGDMVRTPDGVVCRCKECLEGRREVKAGWTPWGKDFGFPA